MTTVNYFNHATVALYLESSNVNRLGCGSHGSTVSHDGIFLSAHRSLVEGLKRLERLLFRAPNSPCLPISAHPIHDIARLTDKRRVPAPEAAPGKENFDLFRTELDDLSIAGSSRLYRGLPVSLSHSLRPCHTSRTSLLPYPILIVTRSS